jgi:hypothetical protein
MRPSSLLLLSAALAALVPLSAVRADPPFHRATNLAAIDIDISRNGQAVTGVISHNGNLDYVNSTGRTATLEMYDGSQQAWVAFHTETLPATVENFHVVSGWLPQPLRGKALLRLRLSPGDDNPKDDVFTRSFGFTNIERAPALPNGGSDRIWIRYGRIVRH